MTTVFENGLLQDIEVGIRPFALPGEDGKAFMVLFLPQALE